MSESQFDFGNWVDDPRVRRPFTIQKLNNAEMTELILTYYKGESGYAIDPTFGAGTFWKKKPHGWRVDYFDKEPLLPKCKKATWLDLPAIVHEKVDALVWDPPFIPVKQRSGKGMEVGPKYHEGGKPKYSNPSRGFDLDKTAGYSRTNPSLHKSAAFTESMKYGDGEMTLPISRAFSAIMKEDAILVFKNQELKSAPGFVLYDYLIQDNGFQPDGFRMSKPKARPNHAFWMIFKIETKKSPKNVRTIKLTDWPYEEVVEA